MFLARTQIIIALTGTCFALAACQRTADPVASGSGPAAASSQATIAGTSAGPDAKPGVVVADARLVLPAVGGRPAAAYFTLTNSGKAPITLSAVSVSGAKEAQMHQTAGGSMAAVPSVDVPAGGSVSFAPGGRHVMVFGLPATLKAGGGAELTLTFKDGDKASVPLTIEPAGGAVPMAGMKME